MRIYGLKISKKERDTGGIMEKGETLNFFYTPMSFIDWKTYSPLTSRYDSSSIRYILGTYLREFTSDGVSKEIQDVFKYDVNVQKTLIDDMFDKSIFGNDEKFRGLVDESISHSRTLYGCYDFFLYVHLPLDAYFTMLDQDAETRAHIIGMLEQSRDVNVKERFNSAIENNIAVNLTSTSDEYKKQIQRYKKTGRMNPPAAQNPGTSEKLPPNVQAMIEASRKVLSEQLNVTSPPKQKPAYNWQSDEMNFKSMDNE